MSNRILPCLSQNLCISPSFCSVSYPKTLSKMTQKRQVHPFLISNLVAVCWVEQKIRLLASACACTRLSHIQLFATPRALALQAPLSMARMLELSRPPPGDLPKSEIKHASLRSPALAGSLFTTCATWEAPFPTLLSFKSGAGPLILSIYLSQFGLLSQNTIEQMD